ncbi:signal peptidase I [Streptomyces xinghaiensis]|uniref:signal peptidase I n=1 Tax=Streptomyces xinghaiensis TaxID=1038928 RepID=UPI0003112CBE|nr:signal peptidase I [Streptomyces xinghaiensis]
MRDAEGRPGRKLAIAALALIVAGLGTLVAGVAWLRADYITTTMPSDHMAPTHRRGDLIVAERTDGSGVRAGDVVLFEEKRWFPGGQLTMQRVIATGGDRVSCCEGDTVSVNGEPLDEPYVLGDDPVGVPDRTYDVKVPEGRLFVLGDYRANSADSRFHLSERSGTVAAGTVRGRVLDDGPSALLWPAGVAVLGALMTSAGLVLGMTSWIVRRRARMVPPPR